MADPDVGRLGAADGCHLTHHDCKDLHVAEVAPHQEAKDGHGLEDLLEHERDPIALGNRDMQKETVRRLNRETLGPRRGRVEEINSPISLRSDWACQVRCVFRPHRSDSTISPEISG